MIARATHPVAWWAWSLLLAAAVLRTRNPLLLVLLACVAWFVVVSRRPDAPWARAFGSFLRLGLVVLVVRLVFQVLFGARIPGHELFTTPSIQLPEWLAGVSLGGTVTAESLVSGACDGLQIAVLLACIGAANSLASPYRLLRSMPAVLYEAGVAVTVAMTFAPHAGAAARQVREARRLRGRPSTGIAGLRGLAVPVLESALDRSLTLAASMDSRGYGRRALVAPARRRASTAGMTVGMLALLVGTYGLMDVGAPSGLGLPAIGLGAAVLAVTVFAGGVPTTRTRYRPDPWQWPEWVTVVSGALTLLALVFAGRGDASALNPPLAPLAWPTLPLVAVIGALAAVVPAFATPEQP